MMFGPWGNDDRADADPRHPPRTRRRDQLRRHRRRLLQRRVGGDRRRGPAGSSRRCRARDEVLHADGRPAQPQRRLPEMDHAGGRELAASPEDGLHRPVPSAPPQPDDRRRGDPRRADRPRAPGQGPLHRIVLVPGQPDRRGAMGLPRPEPGPVRHRAAPVLDPGPRYRGGRAPDRAAVRHGNPRVQPAVRWLADRTVAQGRPRYADVSCTPERPLRHEHTGEPAQTRRRRRACAARRAVRNDDDRARTGMGDQPPGRHLGDHRPADHGATRVAAPVGATSR